jgi:quercetin dioxygenase-like cupin family protein
MATRPFSLVNIRKKWRARGFTLNRQSDAAGKAWPEHEHAVGERVRLLKDAIEMTVKGQSRRLVPGAQVRVPAHAKHRIRNPGPARATYLYGFRRKPSRI